MSGPSYFHHPRRRQSRGLPSIDVAEPAAPARQPVPWRTIWASIFSVAVTYVAYQSFLAVGRVITSLVVAIFFAIVLTPPVDFLQHKAHIRRGVATLIVFLVGLGL